MGTVLFLIFAVMEIALVILTLTKQNENKLWRRNRTLATAAELLIVVVAVITAGNRWRLYCCIAILVIRLIVALITWFIQNKKNVERKKKAFGLIFGAVMSLIIIGFSLVPAFVFTGYHGLKTSGEFEVAMTQGILTDSSRTEKYETDGSCREIPVHFYYPENADGSYPLVIFSHGSFGYYQSNTSAYMELASNGYVVVSVDHPYYAFFTKDTNGQTIIVDMSFMQTAIDVQNGLYTQEDEFNVAKEWMNIRTADIIFVLDSIKSASNSGTLDSAWYTASDTEHTEILDALAITDTGKIGLMGHSIGGAVSVEIGRERDDITAVIDIDGTMLGEWQAFENDSIILVDEPYPIPVLALDNQGHGEGYEDTSYVNRHMLDNAVDGREMYFANTEHMDFTDLPLMSPFLASMFGKGSVDSDEFIPQINDIILNYFNYYLKEEGTLSVPEGYNAVT